MLRPNELLLNFLYNPSFLIGYSGEKINQINQINSIKNNFLILEYFCLTDNYKSFLKMFYEEIYVSIKYKGRINLNKNQLNSCIKMYCYTPLKTFSVDFSKISNTILAKKYELGLKNRQVLPLLLKNAKIADFFGWTPLLIVVRLNKERKINFTRKEILTLISHSNKKANVEGWNSFMFASVNNKNQKLNLNSQDFLLLLNQSELNLNTKQGFTTLDYVAHRNTALTREQWSYLIMNSEKNDNREVRWKTINILIKGHFLLNLREREQLKLLEITDYIDMNQVLDTPFFNAIYAENSIGIKVLSPNTWQLLINKYLIEKRIFDTLLFGLSICSNIKFSKFWNNVVDRESVYNHIQNNLEENFGRAKILNMKEIKEYEAKREKGLIDNILYFPKKEIKKALKI